MSAPRTDTSRARAFVARRGSALDRVRCGVCVGLEAPEALAAALAPAQEADGAFRFADTAGGDPVAGTLRALALLASADRLRGAESERAAGWLAGAQEAGGTWVIDGAGERAGHLATAFVAGFLARTPFARAAALNAAGDWLAARWDPAWVREGDFGMLAAHVHVFANAPHDAADAILQWCGRELERGVRGGRLPALFALRVFALADASVLPGTRLRAADLLDPLAEECGADGAWLPGWPEAWRVEGTLEALAALRRFGAATSFAGRA